MKKSGSFLTNHLKEANENYFEHFLFAFSLAWWIIISGIIHLVHSIFPFLFPRVAVKYIRKINSIMQRRLEICKKKSSNQEK